MNYEGSNEYLALWSEPGLKEALRTFAGSDPNDLALRLSHLSPDERQFLIAQIEGRKLSRHKFGNLSGNADFVFPPRTNLEQASSSELADHKASLYSGVTCVDLTAGFGMDTFSFSSSFKTVHAVERNESLCHLLEHNLNAQGIENVEVHSSDASDFLSRLNGPVDLIYLDPSRRKNGKRVKELREYEPDFIRLFPLMMSKTEQVLIKLSPITDLREVLKEMKIGMEMRIHSLKNECKELLVCIGKTEGRGHSVHCLDLSPSGKRSFSFNLDEEKEVRAEFSDALDYIYLPMTAITKAGAFNSVAHQFGLKKISANSHVYTSSRLSENFPGQVFKSMALVGLNKKQLKTFREKGFTIHPRNIGLSVQEIIKKLNLKEGSDLHLIACRDMNEKAIGMICEVTDA